MNLSRTEMVLLRWAQTPHRCSFHFLSPSSIWLRNQNQQHSGPGPVWNASAAGRLSACGEKCSRFKGSVIFSTVWFEEEHRPLLLHAAWRCHHRRCRHLQQNCVSLITELQPKQSGPEPALPINRVSTNPERRFSSPRHLNKKPFSCTATIRQNFPRWIFTGKLLNRDQNP